MAEGAQQTQPRLGKIEPRVERILQFLALIDA